MPDDNLLATLEQSLRQTRATRNRLAARLADLELEGEKLRTELGEMDAIATQTEAAMFRILSSVLNSVPSHQQQQQQQSPSDAEIEVALRRDDFQGRSNSRQQQQQQQQPQPQQRPTYQTVPRSTLPPVRTDVEVTSERFLDRTIPQATALLLRESGAPLHVNEIYNRLLEGGFQFTGHNPTISIAVSLNRNGRFRKVAPGTFDLTIRDAAQVS
jgi:hypothetical protein